MMALRVANFHGIEIAPHQQRIIDLMDELCKKGEEPTVRDTEPCAVAYDHEQNAAWYMLQSMGAGDKRILLQIAEAREMGLDPPEKEARGVGKGTDISWVGDEGPLEAQWEPEWPRDPCRSFDVQPSDPND